MNDELSDWDAANTKPSARTRLLYLRKKAGEI